MHQSKIAQAILLFSIVLPIIFLYGNIDEFIFLHIGFSHKIDLLGYIPKTDPAFYDTSPSMPGWYLLPVMISKISDIPYDSLLFLPIQQIALSLLYFCVLLNISRNKLISALYVLIISTFSHTIYFALHDIGFVIFLSIILLIIILYRSNNSKTYISASSGIILSLISVIFVSYKTTFYALSFIFSLFLIEYFANKNNILAINQNFRKTFMNLFAVGIIGFLAFNQIFYLQFIPLIRIIDESNMGVYKLLTLFLSSPIDLPALFSLYYNPPVILVYIKTIRAGLIMLFSFLAVSYAVLKHIKKPKETLSLSYKLLIALILVGFSIFIIYNLLGLFDIGMLTISGIVALLILYNENHLKKYHIKKLICIVSFVLIMLNISYQVTVNVHNDFPQKDSNYFEYIKPTAKWFMSYVNGTDLKLRTDVLTRGYLIKEAATDRYITSYPLMISGEELLFITQKSSQSTHDKNVLYLLNFKLNHFSIWQWRIIKSLNYFKKEIESNQGLCKIYSSGFLSAFGQPF